MRPTHRVVYQPSCLSTLQTGTVLHASKALLRCPNLRFLSAASVFVETVVLAGLLLVCRTARMPLTLLLAVVPFPVPRS
jgi:hypothetical protein